MHALLRGALRGEVLTPRDDVHSECPPDNADSRSDVAKTKQSERLAREFIAKRELPAALTQGLILEGNVADHRENQRPGKLNRRRGRIARMPNFDAALRSRRLIDRRIA